MCIRDRVHICLEKVVSSCKDKKEFDSLTQERISAIINDCSEKYLSENLGESVKESPRVISNVENIKENILKIILHLQEELGQSEFRCV